MKHIRKFLAILLFILVGICIVLFVWIRVDRSMAERKQVFEKQPVQYPIRQSDAAVYTNGKQFYEQLLTDMRNAKQYIHISFFSIADDKVSHRFEDLLKQKSKEGVEVYYAVDRLGGILLKEKDRKSLQKAGVHFVYYNKPSFPYLFSSLEQRNHRRISVIDGTIGYTGGFNIGRKYLGERKDLGHWRDYHLRIQGEGVQDLEQQFEADWIKNDHRAVWKDHISNQKGATTLRFKSYSGKGIAYDYANLFHEAQTSITIVTPYFIPNNDRIWNALLDAKKRGVDIKILWSPKSDALLVKEAAYPYIRKALKNNIGVFNYKDGILHGKVLLIDDKVAVVGSTNFDSRSLHLNEELNCYIYDSRFIKNVLEKKIAEDFQHAERIDSSYASNLPFKERVKEYVAHLIEYYL